MQLGFLAFADGVGDWAHIPQEGRGSQVHAIGPGLTMWESESR